MNQPYWLALFWLLAVSSGLLLLAGWWRGRLQLPEWRVLAHGGSGLLALASVLLLLDTSMDGSRWLLSAVVITIATGAMMFGARRKESRFPRPLLWVHLLAAASVPVLLWL